MSKFKLESQDCIIMIIDLQERLMRAMKDYDKVLENSRLLLTAAQQFNLPVVLTEQYPRGLGSTVPEIQEKLNDVKYVEKVSFTACSPDLFKILDDLGRKTVIVAGTETHVCVFQTVRDLIEAGYAVQVVSDAVCSRFDLNYRNGLELMRDVGAVVTNTETVLFDLLKCAGTPEFKVISKQLK